jgi:hypothetical protein
LIWPTVGYIPSIDHKEVATVAVATLDPFKELSETVHKNRDVMTIPVSQLRDLVGARRLGRIVSSEISEKLHAANLGHYPREIPVRANALVRVYRKDSAIDKIMRAVADFENDDSLREFSTEDKIELNMLVDKLKGLVERNST